jgi:glycosyltransferase involved in cell wall biosynthesis
LQDFVKVINGVPNEDLPIWYNASDVFILPSYSESFGIALIEAMSCNLPVITTVNGGSEEIVDKSVYGTVLDDPEDYVSLSQSIDKYLYNDRIKYSNREVVLDKYSRDTMRNSYINVYRKFL